MIEKFSIINQIESGQIIIEPTPFPHPPIPNDPDRDTPPRRHIKEVPNLKPRRDLSDWR